MMLELEEFPLFPLNLVLFPEGLLPLRIFEPRYVDMVSTCLKEKKSFGVVLIKAGKEIRGPVSYYETGTLAIVQSFDQGEDGLLHIVAKGTELFKIKKSVLQKDGLIIAKVRLVIPDIEETEIEFSSLAQLLSKILSNLGELAPPKPWRLDDATWVSYRLAELIPLDNRKRLKILETAGTKQKIMLITEHLNNGGKSMP